MPEKVFIKIKKSILPEYKICFLSALFIGLLAHLYKLVNHLPNWDSLVFRYDAQNMTHLGRWFLSPVCALTSFYDLPFLNGFVALLFYALGAVCIIKIFKIRNKIASFLIGALIISFPTVTSTLFYSYVADGYAIAFFMSTLAALFLTCEKPRYLISICLICLSAAIYQAYITVTVLLLVFRLIDEIIFQNEKPVKTFKKCLKFLLSGLSGILLYYVLLNLILHFTNTQLLDYQGVSSSLSLSSLNLYDALINARNIFLNYFFDFSKGANLFAILNVIIFAIAFVFTLLFIISNKIFNNVYKALLLFALVIAMHFGGEILVFINPNVDYHNLMKMGFSCFYVYFIVLYERANEKQSAIQCWTILIISLFVIFNQIVISNVSYHKAQLSWDKSFAELIRICDRIETTDKSNECDEILVIGYLEESRPYSAYLPPDITGTTDGYVLRHDSEEMGQSVVTSALNDYCSKDYKFLAGEEKQTLLKNETVQNMNTWPNDNSVAVVDGVIVLKLSEE